MLCPICLKNQADCSLVRYFGTNECHAEVCRECAEKVEKMDAASFYREFHDKPRKVCRVCKRSYGEILKTLLVGCPFCYKEFSSELNKITENVQGVKLTKRNDED